MLIDRRTLNGHLADPDWMIFDCRHDLFDAGRGARVYAEGHLPGAHFVPVETALSGTKNGRNGRHPLPAPEDFAAFLNHHGVTAGMHLVAYDDVGGQYAARMWWLARWIGLKHFAVLDGGLPKWLASGFPVTTEMPAVRSGGTVTAQPDFAQVWDTEQVCAGLNAPNCLLLDARAPERFRGEVEPIDPVAGHVPSAQNRFFKANLNPDLTLRGSAELRREFLALLGERPAEQMVHLCGSGVTACVNLLAMEHVGLAGSKLYAGSWSEWIADPARPIARG